eukprot:MONOS_1151.1-p1 / transcript=MONOS_1151.1 / gene=MONOS_1151 / organism=Monocercomonoides_exilis_PA203 / gene_product=unspecified product / transcript_product=unspecified product / location=Mono_scaffold00019:189805-194982(+) / protein_length=1726 / sequence_SO=supercontig / SO=protein_coding / is_pseudo=false
MCRALNNTSWGGVGGGIFVETPSPSDMWGKLKGANSFSLSNSIEKLRNSKNESNASICNLDEQVNPALFLLRRRQLQFLFCVVSECNSVMCGGGFGIVGLMRAAMAPQLLHCSFFSNSAPYGTDIIYDKDSSAFVLKDHFTGCTSTSQNETILFEQDAEFDDNTTLSNSRDEFSECSSMIENDALLTKDSCTEQIFIGKSKDGNKIKETQISTTKSSNKFKKGMPRSIAELMGRAPLRLYEITDFRDNFVNIATECHSKNTSDSNIFKSNQEVTEDYRYDWLKKPFEYEYYASTTKRYSSSSEQETAHLSASNSFSNDCGGSSLPCSSLSGLIETITTKIESSVESRRLVTLHLSEGVFDEEKRFLLNRVNFDIKGKGKDKTYLAENSIGTACNKASKFYHDNNLDNQDYLSFFVVENGTGTFSFLSLIAFSNSNPTYHPLATVTHNEGFLQLISCSIYPSETSALSESSSQSQSGRMSNAVVDSSVFALLSGKTVVHRCTIGAADSIGGRGFSLGTFSVFKLSKGASLVMRTTNVSLISKENGDGAVFDAVVGAAGILSLEHCSFQNIEVKDGNGGVAYVTMDDDDADSKGGGEFNIDGACVFNNTSAKSASSPPADSSSGCGGALYLNVIYQGNSSFYIRSAQFESITSATSSSAASFDKNVYLISKAVIIQTSATKGHFLYLAIPSFDQTYLFDHLTFLQSNLNDDPAKRAEMVKADYLKDAMIGKETSPSSSQEEKDLMTDSVISYKANQIYVRGASASQASLAAGLSPTSLMQKSVSTNSASNQVLPQMLPEGSDWYACGTVLYPCRSISYSLAHSYALQYSTGSVSLRLISIDSHTVVDPSEEIDISNAELSSYSCERYYNYVAPNVRIITGDYYHSATAAKNAMNEDKRAQFINTKQARMYRLNFSMVGYAPTPANGDSTNLIPLYAFVYSTGTSLSVCNCTFSHSNNFESIPVSTGPSALSSSSMHSSSSAATTVCTVDFCIFAIENSDFVLANVNLSNFNFIPRVAVLSSVRLVNSKSNNPFFNLPESINSSSDSSFSTANSVQQKFNDLTTPTSLPPFLIKTSKNATIRGLRATDIKLSGSPLFDVFQTNTEEIGTNKTSTIVKFENAVLEDLYRAQGKPIFCNAKADYVSPPNNDINVTKPRFQLYTTSFSRIGKEMSEEQNEDLNSDDDETGMTGCFTNVQVLFSAVTMVGDGEASDKPTSSSSGILPSLGSSIRHMVRDSSSPVCHWNASTVHFLNCTTTLTDSKFSRFPNGAVTMVGGNMSIYDSTFIDNNPQYEFFPSMRRNIHCEGGGKVTINSLSGGDGDVKYSSSFWLDARAPKEAASFENGKTTRTYNQDEGTGMKQSGWIDSEWDAYKDIDINFTCDASSTPLSLLGSEFFIPRLYKVDVQEYKPDEGNGPSSARSTDFYQMGDSTNAESGFKVTFEGDRLIPCDLEMELLEINKTKDSLVSKKRLPLASHPNDTVALGFVPLSALNGSINEFKIRLLFYASVRRTLYDFTAAFPLRNEIPANATNGTDGDKKAQGNGGGGLSAVQIVLIVLPVALVLVLGVFIAALVMMVRKERKTNKQMRVQQEAELPEEVRQFLREVVEANAREQALHRRGNVAGNGPNEGGAGGGRGRGGFGGGNGMGRGGGAGVGRGGSRGAHGMFDAFFPPLQPRAPAQGASRTRRLNTVGQRGFIATQQTTREMQEYSTLPLRNERDADEWNESIRSR